MIFGSKIVKIDVTGDSGKPLLTVEKNFVFPKNADKGSDENIIIIKGKNLPVLEHNEVVEVVTTSKSNDRVKYTGIVTVSLDTQLNIKLLHSSDTQVLQERRRYFKVNVEEYGRALYFVRNEKTMLFEEPVSATITNINVGGIFLVIETPEFEVGDIIQLELDLFIDYTLTAPVKVLRVQRNEGVIVGYGCEFQALTASQEDYIGRYIYKVQSERRLREAELEEKV